MKIETDKAMRNQYWISPELSGFNVLARPKQSATTIKPVMSNKGAGWVRDLVSFLKAIRSTRCHVATLLKRDVETATHLVIV